MKAFYKTAGGSLDGSDLKPSGGYRIITRRDLRPGKHLSDGDVVKMGRMLIAGTPVKDIEQLLGISRKTIGRWKKKLKLSAPRSAKISEFRKELQVLLERYEQSR